MPFLKSTTVTDEQRQAHDRHDWRTVASVIAVLAAYLYLFTSVTTFLGIPAPGTVIEAWGFPDADIIFEEGIVLSSIRFSYDEAGWVQSTTAMMAFFLTVMATFLAFYFAPVRMKQPILVGASFFIILFSVGIHAVTGLLFGHIAAYLVFHPSRSWKYFPVLGMLGATTFAEGGSVLQWLASFVSLTFGMWAIYSFAVLPLLANPKAAPWVRGITANLTLILVVLFSVLYLSTGVNVLFHLGIMMFFWHLARLVMYQLDYNAGKVPKDLPLHRYLATFFSPGSAINIDWGVEVGLGYAYTHNSFLRRDKNKIIMSGVSLLWLGMGYLILGDWARNLLLDLLSDMGFEVYGGYIRTMVQRFMQGEEVSTPSVLLTTLMDTLRWTLRFVGVLHFKVALWRICGYDFEPYFNKPWLATNLVVFWARYTYYYREFLLQAFYYPVFLRFFKKQPTLRLIVATFAAAGVGNLIWGHVTEHAEQFTLTLSTWPYYFLLSAGISLTALYLLKYSKRKKRRPWTRSPWLVTDVLASILTIQYFSWIHVMARPWAGSTEWDLFRLMMRGIGIYL